MNKRRILNQSGMTLIEIMLVLVLLGGVLSFIGSKVFETFSNANFKSAKVMMSEVSKSLQMYHTDCGSYPTSLTELSENASNCSNWGPEPYMKKIPKDPWNHEFEYNGSGSSFQLKSYGADGEEGGEGKNADILYEEG